MKKSDLFIQLIQKTILKILVVNLKTLITNHLKSQYKFY
jgi:hypothetical protein